MSGISPVHAAASRPSGRLAQYSYSGPSAVTCSGYSFFAWRGEDNNQINIQYNNGGGNITVTFTDTTPDTPAVACYNNDVYFAWEANDSSHDIWYGYWNISNCSLPCTLSGRGTIPGQSTGKAPALGVNNGGLYAAWKSNTGTTIYTEIYTPGSGWYGQTPINDTTVDGPALTSFQNHLWIAWAGTDSGHRIWYGWYNGSSDLSNHGSLPSQTTAIRVALTTYNSKLLFAWKGFTNNNIYTESYVPPSNYVFNGPLKDPYFPPQTTLPPGLDGNYCYFTGTDNDINVELVYSS